MSALFSADWSGRERTRMLRFLHSLISIWSSAGDIVATTVRFGPVNLKYLNLHKSEREKSRPYSLKEQNIILIIL